MVSLIIKRRYSVKNIKRLAHTVCKCKYHIVLSPKYRVRILKGEVGKSIRDIIRQLCEWKKAEILEGNVQEDHIHLVLSFSPKYSVSEVLDFVNGKCAIKIFDRHAELKKRYRGRHFLAKGYFISTVGLDEEQIKKYVRRQLNKDRIMDQLKL